MTVQGPIWRTVTGMESPSALKMWVMPTLRPRRPVAMFDLALVRPATTGRGGLTESGWRARTCSRGVPPCQGLAGSALPLAARGLRRGKVEHPGAVLGAQGAAKEGAGPPGGGKRQRRAPGVARVAPPRVVELERRRLGPLEAEAG